MLMRFLKGHGSENLAKGAALKHPQGALLFNRFIRKVALYGAATL
jgi:hypothetical protein